MNRQEHIRQVLAVAESHRTIVDTMVDLLPDTGCSRRHLTHLVRLDRVGFAHHVISQQMADDQERAERFAVAFRRKLAERLLS